MFFGSADWEKFRCVSSALLILLVMKKCKTIDLINSDVDDLNVSVCNTILEAA